MLYSTCMQLIGLAAAVLATVISVVALSRLAYVWHDTRAPRSLSELAAAQDRLLGHFRNVLWVCGTLFAVAIYGAIAPRLVYGFWLGLAWTVTYLGDVLLAVVPARGKTMRIHMMYGHAMAVGMWAMALLFCLGFTGGLKIAALCVLAAMTLSAVLTVADKPRYIFYELAFLYLSHISIVLGAIFVTR